MSEELDTNTNDNTDVSGDTNDKSNVTGDTGTDNSKTDNNQEEKKLTQSEVNEIVKRAKIDAERAAKTKFDKSLEGKHIFTEEELNARVKESVDAVLKEESLKSIRVKIQTEYGLNDHQISKLEGNDEKSLKEDAEKTYGKPKKEAPKLSPGSRQPEQEDNQSLHDRLKKGLTRKRDWLDN